MNETPCADDRSPTLPQTLLGEADGMVNDYEVARMCGVKRETCIRWREKKVGPPFYRINRCVRYSENQVLAWLRTRRVVPRRA